MPDMEIRELREFLFKNIKRGNWEAVVAKYEEAYEEAQKLQLTPEGDTVLHLAVINNQEEIVEKLIKLICKSRVYKRHLEATNASESNPLHLAAELGSARMCHAIASAHEGLVDMRNKDSETPLFLAAVHGHKNVFYCLYYFCMSDLPRASANCRRNNGDTVLHVALGNEQFDLAYQIIHVNPEASHWVDEQGFTSLHVLANKPTCFKSGSNIRGWWRNFIYNSMFVDQLKSQQIETLGNEWKKLYMSKAQKTPRVFPDNYETCIQVFLRLWDAILKAREPPTTNFPKNYRTCIDFFQIVLSCITIILGFGFSEITNIRKKKEKHTWSVQVMKTLLELAQRHEYYNDGNIPMGLQAEIESEISCPYSSVDDEFQFPYDNFREWKEPKPVILLAAKNGVLEMVMEIFEHFPALIFETSKSDKKNVVLLAAEYRQWGIYKFFCDKENHTENLFRAVDKDGNSALHLAASSSAPKYWHINDALQMQCEVKWFKFVKDSLPPHIVSLRNKNEETASRIFKTNHENIVQKGKDWLHATSQSCSVVATLIATVAFATSATIPGGNDNHGAAILQKEQGFFIFAISSLIALSLSTTSVIIFFAIATSRFDIEEYFGSFFPWTLLVGFSSLYFSIIFMLISFCTGHYFLINHSLQNKALLLYTLTFLPVAFYFCILHLPLIYSDLLVHVLTAVPIRRVDDANLCD